MNGIQLKTGSLVYVELFGGKVETRKVVEVCGKTVYVATETELETARHQGREPECVGFNVAFVRALDAV